MKKKNVVKSKILFNDIIQKGKRNTNKYFVICSVSKNELNNNYDFNKNKKKIIHLLIFSHILILLEIIFSSLFVSYFVKLSNFIYINHHQDKNYSQT